jgi:hypothetical protein
MKHEPRLESVAILPKRERNGRACVAVSVRDDTTQRVSYIGKFALSPLENAVTPPMMCKVWKALDEGSCLCIRLNGQEHVDPKAAHCVADWAYFSMNGRPLPPGFTSSCRTLPNDRAERAG